MVSKWLIISRKVAVPVPIIFPASKTVSKSLFDKPKLDIANDGVYFLRSLTGFVFVNK